jgi:gamma-glutamyltranspeptidase/glutathione hydrolase
MCEFVSEKRKQIDDRIARFKPNSTNRPGLSGTEAMVVSGHYLATVTGWDILNAGGNAIDAGIAVGLATNVIESVFTGIGGVAPCLMYLADKDEVMGISGVGTLPKSLDADYFINNHGGAVTGIPATVVPAALDAWLTALELYGTMSFADVAADAVRLATKGFPVYPFLTGLLTYGEKGNRQYPANAEIYLPNGKVPQSGETFVQADLGRVLQYLMDAEKAAAGQGRAAGIQAVRHAFYEGDIAREILKFHSENGGHLTASDMANFRVKVEPPSKVTYRGVNVFAGGAYCQGPSMLQALKILEGYDLRAMGHNSEEYIHVITEAIKIVASDRDAYIGDPDFIEVPLQELLSEEFARQRKLAIGRNATDGVPAPGIIRGSAWPDEMDRQAGQSASSRFDPSESPYGTSYFCVIDKQGNLFSATPSDGASNGAYGPVIPGLGFVPSYRGISLWADHSHPSRVQPGKRPRLTMGPAISIDRQGSVSGFGTPGTDVQLQAMLQTFFAVEHFGFTPQEAVELPRFATYSFPGSFYPHSYSPRRLNVEEGIADEAVAGLAERGHDVEWWPTMEWLAGSMCYVKKDGRTGVISAGADPRRTAYAIGR